MSRNPFGRDPFESFVADVLSNIGVEFRHQHNPTNAGAQKVREEYARQQSAERAKSEVVDMVKCTVCGTYFEPHALMVRWNKPGAHSRKKFLCTAHWK